MTFLSVIEFGAVSFIHRSNEKNKLIHLKRLDPARNANINSLVNFEIIQQNENNNNKFKIKASSIDTCARIFFPVVFFIFHLIYWTIYYLTLDFKNFKE